MERGAGRRLGTGRLRERRRVGRGVRRDATRRGVCEAGLGAGLSGLRCPSWGRLGPGAGPPRPHRRREPEREGSVLARRPRCISSRLRPVLVSLRSLYCSHSPLITCLCSIKSNVRGFRFPRAFQSPRAGPMFHFSSGDHAAKYVPVCFRLRVNRRGLKLHSKVGAAPGGRDHRIPCIRHK